MTSIISKNTTKNLAQTKWNVQKMKTAKGWSIITTSKAYADELHIQLEKDVSVNPKVKINVH